ncbi:hypothetical protein LUZ60_008952 [Juncus effusus]|nr:hypothetical protein LUZ60_008952 [Juncus effusus]
MNNMRRDQSNGGAVPLVAVAIDKDKGSQNALKWALDNVISKGQTITLVHVNTHKSSAGEDAGKEIFVPYRIFCKRKDIKCNDVILDDTEVAKAIVEFISQAAIDKIVLGAPARGLLRLRGGDVPTTVMKSAPDFCSVYVISKNKASSLRKAVREAPSLSPLRAQIQNQTSIKQDIVVEQQVVNAIRGEQVREARNYNLERGEMIRSPFTQPGAPRFHSRPNSGLNDRDLSFISNGRPSMDGMLTQQRISHVSNDSIDLSFSSRSSVNTIGFFSESTSTSFTTTLSVPDDVEAEVNRLRMQLKQTMEMYNTACKEALKAKQQAMEFYQWKSEEDRRLMEAKMAKEAALQMAERERVKCNAAIEAAEASKRIAELEAQKRITAEKKAMMEVEERKRAICGFGPTNVRYRKYSIDEIEEATEKFVESRKIGEGGYGPVFKCYLDHTPVAVKVLRPDAAQGRSQFQQEVEILSCIRHPNMVLLLGACPEYGCLVYELMTNGSLDDCLFRRGNRPPLSWQHRFRIAAEIATALLFLHQTKPEPLVHRDLKPANILLDRNYVSKISDVGLARLVPPSVADTVTQYRMTSTAGTFCYIDPEYQQTGMLGTKSDIYSFGILLLQIITGRPPMGLTHHVEHALEHGTFKDLLDPTVIDWPLEEAECLARLALKCAELRRKDRPDLGGAILPELDRLRAIGEESLGGGSVGSGGGGTVASQVSIEQGFGIVLLSLRQN